MDAILRPVNPMVYNHKNYNCEIRGDDKSIPHFGPTMNGDPMPKMILVCEHADEKKQLKEESKWLGKQK